MSKAKKALFTMVSVDINEDPRFAVMHELVGADGLALWLYANNYAKRRLTDGRVHAALLKTIYPGSARPVAEVAAGLVASGLWRRVSDTEFEIVGWRDWNDSREEVETKREQKREADRAYQRGRRSGDPVSDNDPTGDRQRTDARPTATRQRPDSDPTTDRHRTDTDPTDDQSVTVREDVGEKTDENPTDTGPTSLVSGSCRSRVTEIREQRVNSSTHKTRTSAGDPPAPTRAPARAPMSPEGVAILAELARHPVLAVVADADRADLLAGRLMGKPKPMAWIAQAIADAAADIAGGGAYPNAEATWRKVRTYFDNAREPRDAAAVEQGGGKTAPAGAPGGKGGSFRPKGGYEPSSGFSAVPSDEEIWGPDGPPPGLAAAR